MRNEHLKNAARQILDAYDVSADITNLGESATVARARFRRALLSVMYDLEVCIELGDTGASNSEGSGVMRLLKDSYTYSSGKFKSVKEHEKSLAIIRKNLGEILGAS